MRKSIVINFLAIFLGSMMLAIPAGAGLYTPLTLPVLDTNIAATSWADGPTYNSVFPGLQTWNGVPFNLENRTNDCKVFYAGGSLNIPVNIYGVTKAYTIINSAWGLYGSVVGKIEFYGAGAEYYAVDLVEGINVRDHYAGDYNDVIDGINALPAFDNADWRARLDMQLYTLPSVFSHVTLENIVFTSYGLGRPQGNLFIAAATVENVVPIPGSLWLLSSGLLGLEGWRRFRKG
jgi:hypothetical protein